MGRPYRPSRVHSEATFLSGLSDRHVGLLALDSRFRNSGLGVSCCAFSFEALVVELCQQTGPVVVRSHTAVRKVEAINLKP